VRLLTLPLLLPPSTSSATQVMDADGLELVVLRAF
jgi:hypothetical protein